jgi:hypothetical protein
MNDLEARKRALVAESEVYRQALALEVQQIQSHCAGIQRRIDSVRRFRSLFFILPLLAPLIGLRRMTRPAQAKRAAGWRGLVGTAMVGWRLYQKFGPVLRSVLPKFSLHARNAPPAETSRHRR